MGGKTNSKGFGNRQLWKFRTDKEKIKAPLFYRDVKNEAGNYETQPGVDEMTGYLKNITVEDYEYEGKKKQKLVFILDDDESPDEMKLEMGFNQLSRTLLNTLAGAKEIGHIYLRGYRNKKGYDSIFVEIDKKEAKWKFDYKDLPQPTEVMFQGNLEKDYFPVDEFFKKLIATDILPKLKSEFARPASTFETVETTTHEPQKEYGKTQESAPQADDLPF